MPGLKAAGRDSWHCWHCWLGLWLRGLWLRGLWLRGLWLALPPTLPADTCPPCRTKYESHEAKRQLCNSYDLFMADDRILPSLPKLIGGCWFRDPAAQRCGSAWLLARVAGGGQRVSVEQRPAGPPR